MPRFIDPRTDFGFKRLFGQEDSKDILKQFLFDVLALSHPIQDLTYIPAEQLPRSPEDRRGIYDVYCVDTYCVDTMGRRFIVEMQRANLPNVKERALYYSTFAITYQAQRGADWQFNLLPIYCLAILDYDMDDDKRYLRRIQLMDTQQKTVFYDKLTFVVVELGKFKQPLADATEADKWIFLLKHMPELQDIPKELAAEPFSKAFEISEEASLSFEERWYYEGSLKQARTFNAQLTAAENKGHAEGRREERLEIAGSMRTKGLAVALIAQITGLTEAEIANIKNNIKEPA